MTVSKLTKKLQAKQDKNVLSKKNEILGLKITREKKISFSKIHKFSISQILVFLFIVFLVRERKESGKGDDFPNFPLKERGILERECKRKESLLQTKLKLIEKQKIVK